MRGTYGVAPFREANPWNIQCPSLPRGNWSVLCNSKLPIGLLVSLLGAFGPSFFSLKVFAFVEREDQVISIDIALREGR